MAYKRLTEMMKNLFVLILAMLPFLNVVAQQDSEGYTDVTHNLRSGYVLREIKTPSVNINNKLVVNDGDNSNVILSYYNELTSTVLKNGNKVDTYKICFSIEESSSFHIAENGRLLIKLGNDKIVTLSAWRDSDADSIKNGKYHANVEYKITAKQLDTIIKKNVKKFRIEKIMGEFIDIEPDFNVSETTKEFKTGLYDRLKTKKDSFLTDF